MMLDRLEICYSFIIIFSIFSTVHHFHPPTPSILKLGIQALLQHFPEMPTSGNLKSGDLGQFMMSYMKSSKFTFMTVVPK